MAQTAPLVGLPARHAPRPPDRGDLRHPPTPVLRPVEPPRRDTPDPSTQPARWRWLLRVAVVALAVGAPVVAFAGQREVEVDVEGEVTNVRTYAAEGEEILRRQGIEPASGDLVAPSAPLADGERLTFRRAKTVHLVLDGKPTDVVARGLTVSEALTDLGLEPGPEDHVFPDPSTELDPGLEIYVRNAIHTTLRVDGQQRDVVSSADSVRTLLAQAGVSLGADDYVVPGLDVEPADGMAIRVVRVRHFEETKTVRLPFKVVTRDDPNLESGTRRVEQQGAEGLKTQRFAVTTENGSRTSNRLVGETVDREPRDHIVRVGSKEPEYSGADGHSEEGIASWFRAEGLVAAHRTLPIGTVVKVTSLEDGKSVSVRINQRGPYVDGRVIDLSDAAFERLAPLGKGTLQVKVEA